MNTSKLQSKLLKSIEENKVEPKGMAQIWAEWWSVWFLWLLAVVFGALAVAGTIFAFTETAWSYRKLTGQSFLSLFVEVLPVLWILFALLGILLAKSLFRRTDKGYRYSMSMVLVLSFSFVFLAGSGLYAVGAGQIVEQGIGARLPMHRTIGDKTLIKLRLENPHFFKVGIISENTSEEGVSTYELMSFQQELVDLGFSSDKIRKICTRGEGPIGLVGFKDKNGLFIVCNAHEIPLQLSQYQDIQREERMELLMELREEDLSVDEVDIESCDDLFAHLQSRKATFERK